MKKMLLALVIGLAIALFSGIAMAGQTVTFELIKDLDAGTLSFEPELKLTRDVLSGWVGYKLITADEGDPADVLTLGLGRTPFAVEYEKPLSEDSDGTLELKLTVEIWQFKYKRSLVSDAQGTFTAKLTLGF